MVENSRVHVDDVRRGFMEFDKGREQREMFGASGLSLA
jgi:hypothetical protein